MRRRSPASEPCIASEARSVVVGSRRPRTPRPDASAHRCPWARNQSWPHPPAAGRRKRRPQSGTRPATPTRRCLRSRGPTGARSRSPPRMASLIRSLSFGERDHGGRVAPWRAANRSGSGRKAHPTSIPTTTRGLGPPRRGHTYPPASAGRATPRPARVPALLRTAGRRARSNDTNPQRPQRARAWSRIPTTNSA